MKLGNNFTCVFSPKGSGNYWDLDKTRVKLFPNFIRHHLITHTTTTTTTTHNNNFFKFFLIFFKIKNILYNNNNNNNNNNKQSRVCQIIDVACLFNTRKAENEREMIDHYQDLKVEVQKMWNCKSVRR